MSTKTIALTGSEIMAEFSGANAWLRNDGADVIYAAAKPGITAGADGVVAILAGQSAPVYGANGAVWLTGTGSVQLIGSDYSTNPFKSSVTSGSVAAQIARAVSNPNLLINFDFAVNQRGLASYSYTTNGYTVDRWKINSNAKLTVNDGFVTFENTTEKGTVTLYQIVENPAAFSGKTVTLSFDYDLKTEGAYITIQTVTNGSWNPSSAVSLTDTGRNVQSTVLTLPENLTELRLALVIHSTDSAPLAIVDVYGAKLELGSLATPFTPPDPATELAKCQRYYQKINSQNAIFGSGFIGGSTTAYITVPIIPMRIKPTLTFAGTAYIWAANHIGSSSYSSESAVLDPYDKNGNSVFIEFSITADTGSIGQGCSIQFRDADSYIELSAEL